MKLTVGVSFQIHSFPFHSYSALILLTSINIITDTRHKEFEDDIFILIAFYEIMSNFIKLII